IRTTGIFCRPSCPARPALPKNREFHATAKAALFAGYRPCKRCRPLESDGKPPDWVARLLGAVERDPQSRWRDADLRRLAVNPARARRFFVKHYGMTFQAYCRGRRMNEALQQIKRGTRLDDVALGNGYDSHSGFRDAFARTFGRPPGKGRDAGCVAVAWAESPLGPLLMGATEDGVCLLEFTDRRALETQIDTVRRRFRSAVVPGNHEYLDQLQDELERYFAGKLQKFRVPLMYPGTPFQQSVWEELLKIPYGETRSYEDVARAVGTPTAQRAVGTANGSNRIAIVIPCHRVVNKGGQLGGYGGGLWRKQYLLDLERGVTSPLFASK
ncbi:MAG TPA: methylated-DNA--[protein]-cysteine S-methyltransferase, partial [Gemmataceae bacterium]|nr:methylated-DNA--[protein]-cysteine S-methyltransferase [Gemmataceae bacterium]